MLVAKAVIGFFTSLGILSNLLSISTLFIFMLVVVALLVRVHHELLQFFQSCVPTSEQALANLVARGDDKLIVCLWLIIGSSIGTAAYWGLSDGWIGYTITVPIWVIGTVGLWVLVPHARNPELWGVPLVPWLPSTSIAINIFLLGSIDKASFIRFGIWTGIMLVYYLFFGLHLSYDNATASGEKRMDDGAQLKVVEDGVNTSATGSGSAVMNVGNASTFGGSF
ncbi:cationic amino acid transporter 1-like [Alnus glutinosa]|uniref:cationic amino acid transporter 1-like n=1 Tax=Alnus glutinosa TaxID=3517 RepID=UPI002D79ABB7|nr:cationic amino acid transporter 1-like [Alnus glutinosa]